MSETREQRGASDAPDVLPPGALTALLRDLAEPDSSSTAGEHEATLRAGSFVGRFELLREIGHGGFGVVWEARDGQLQRSVAVKVLRAGRGMAAREERLLAEAEAAARLSHPNVVTLLDAGRSDGRPFLVLELLRGETLAQRLEEGPMTAVEALRIATEVAKGLAHAHARGVVHRDLTPGNVFLCDEGPVKILDLGMAHAFGRPKADGGTLAYMAPEQRRGAPEDERTDVFALGVILYRMLTGELPFREADAKAVRWDRAPPSVDLSAASSLPVLVERMLAVDPVGRPRDAGELLPGLSASLSELSTSDVTGQVHVGRTRSRRPWRRALFAAAGALAAAGVVGLAGAWRARSGPPAKPLPSIAVLAFADMSPQHDQEYLSDGVAEEILNALARVEGLRVTGRTSSFSFKGKREDVRSIGARLGVAAVLEGSVRKADRQVRITAQLVDAATGYQTWSATYDRDLGDVFAVEADIARAVVAEVGVRMRTGATLAVAALPTTSPGAHEYYLLAKAHRPFSTYEPGQRPEDLFQKALDLDPRYAPAWAALATSLVGWSQYLRLPPDAAEARSRRALEAAERAISLAPEFADGYEARGHVRRGLGDWVGARADFERALALEPGQPDAHRHYAFLLMQTGESSRALEHMQDAVRLDPLDAGAWSMLGYYYVTAGDLERARAACRRTLEIVPDAPITMWNLGEIELLAGKPAEALDVFERNKLEWYRLLGRAMAHHDLGHERDSREALATLVASYGAKDPYLVAAGYAWRGELDPAFLWLDRAIAQRGAPGVREASYDQRLRNLRGDPRFASVLRRLNVPAPAQDH